METIRYQSTKYFNAAFHKSRIHYYTMGNNGRVTLLNRFGEKKREALVTSHLLPCTTEEVLHSFQFYGQLSLVLLLNWFSTRHCIANEKIRPHWMYLCVVDVMKMGYNAHKAGI